MTQTVAHREDAEATAYADDPALRAQVLRPYRTHCRYLADAEVREAENSVTASCTFDIGESWYIDDTGHFNAVEFNLCYNQAVYYLIAKCVKERLLGLFSSWTLEDYWQRQLSDILIVRYHSRFRRAIHGRRVFAEVAFDKVVVRTVRDSAPLLLIDTTCRFWDDKGGKCDGQVTIAVTNPPQLAAR
jgi:hypothetical protein